MKITRVIIAQALVSAMAVATPIRELQPREFKGFGKIAKLFILSALFCTLNRYALGYADY